jgi:hypothetical protein
MGFPANRRAQQVRQILSTFYRASQLSVEMFGRSSAFYLPRNLYHHLAASTAMPSNEMTSNDHYDFVTTMAAYEADE